MVVSSVFFYTMVSFFR